jgi:hypothetical protein
MRAKRALFLVIFLVFFALARSSAPEADVSIVEDWAQHAVGAAGIPPGWSAYATIGGRPAYDFAVTEEDGRRALRLKSHDEHSTIAKKIQVDLRATPILEWTWKIVKLPEGADVRKKETSDLTGHILVAWPRFPALLRTRLIGYAWDTTAPAQSVYKSQKTGAVTFFVVRSGPRDLNRWLTERRNVYEDYKKVFGEDPENPQAVVVSIDTNDTHSSAEAFIGRIRFTSGSGDAAALAAQLVGSPDHHSVLVEPSGKDARSHVRDPRRRADQRRPDALPF